MNLIVAHPVIDHHPDHLESEAGSCLGVGHDKDVVTPELEVVDPLRDVLGESPGEPRHPRPLVLGDVVHHEVVGGDRGKILLDKLLVILRQLDNIVRDFLHCDAVFRECWMTVC